MPPTHPSSNEPVQVEATAHQHSIKDPLLHENSHSNSAKALTTLVENTATDHDVSHTIHTPTHKLSSEVVGHWLKDLVPGLEKVASEYHFGNFVAVRDAKVPGEMFFESMPIYPRLGMHILFYGGTQTKLLHNKSVETILKDLSIRQGEIYDSPQSIKSIPSFIHTYKINLDELLEPDIKNYKTFNEFFYRRLKPDVRPVQNADDPTGICSAADCRLTVYDKVSLAKEFWIKGKNFNIPNLLNVSEDSEVARRFEGGCVALFRLAPSDYHRFHSPIDGYVSSHTKSDDIPGEYYTVNPQAVNEPGFDVLTCNKRSVLHLSSERPNGETIPVAFVAVGAMLVGSINWTIPSTSTSSTSSNPPTPISRGQELGYFAYGGSTIILIFPKDKVKFDDDLVRNSMNVGGVFKNGSGVGGGGVGEGGIETYVRVGESIGRWV